MSTIGVWGRRSRSRYLSCLLSVEVHRKFQQAQESLHVGARGSILGFLLISIILLSNSSDA